MNRKISDCLHTLNRLTPKVALSERAGELEHDEGVLVRASKL